MKTWFKEAGLGLFIHWGVYAVHGRGEWCQYQEQIPTTEYDAKYMDAFTADEYDPEVWAYYAKLAGMTYMTLTVKHHDGFCLFDTKTTDRNAVKRGPHRDLVRPFVEACRKYGLKCGLYFSLPDWSQKAFFQGPQLAPEAWGEFLDRIIFPQVREICTNYGPIDVLWYDNIVGMSNGKEFFDSEDVNFRKAAEKASDHKLTAADYRSEELNAMVRKLQPKILINDRSLLQEDFYTAEQNLTGPKEPDRLWECCITMNSHWGYFPADPYYKSVFQILHTLTAVTYRGGNFLLNVGPDRYGRLNQQEKAILEAVGDWMKVNAEAVGGMESIALNGGSYGCAAKKGNYVYLYLHFPNEEGYITVPHCQMKLCNPVILGSEDKLSLEYKGDKLIVHGTPRPKTDWIYVVRLEIAEGRQ